VSVPSRSGYLAIAIAVHAGVLWGVHFGPPSFISAEEEAGDAIEVGLVEGADANPAPAVATPEPPTPEPPPPEPPAPTPPEPQPMSEPPPPKPDAIPEPTPEPPKPKPKPAPAKPPSRPAARPSAPAASAPPAGGSPSGTPGAASGQAGGKPGRGDATHATWRNRIRPAYPSAARAAGRAGRVLIIVNVNALGRAAGARVYQSSGVASLDQAALSAARASTYNPKRIAGLPLPDTITIPYTFRLEDR